jgi:hypothetical protein
MNSFDKQQRTFNIVFYSVLAFVAVMLVGIITAIIVGAYSGRSFYAQHPECVYTRCVTVINGGQNPVVVPEDKR